MYKNKRIKKASALFSAAALLIAQPVQAFDVSYDGGTSDFYVVGDVDLKKAGQIITLKVEDDSGNLLYAWQTETDVNGEWEFAFALDYEGDVKINVSENGVLGEEQTIYRSAADDVTNALAAMNGNGNIKNAVQTYATTLQIDYAEFLSYASGGLLESFMDSYNYTSVSDVKRVYNLGKFLVTVQRASTSEAVLAAENTYPEVSEATRTAVSNIYENYSDAEKLVVLSRLKGKTFNDMTAYAKARDEAVIINEINAASTYSEKYKIVEDYNSVLGLDLSKYASLGSKFQTFKQTLFSKDNTDVTTLKANAEAVYNNLKNKTDGGSSIQGGGGGGGTAIQIGNNFASQGDIPEIPQFNDMADYDWARVAVYTLAARQVINGKSAGVYAPADSVTRAEFIKILAGAFELSGNASVKFTDVPASHWAYPFVSAAVAKGIVNGTSANNFGTDDKITRQDMAAICGRLMDYLNIEADGEEVSFADENEISDYAKEAVKKLAKAGVVNGVGANKFAPKNNTTRAEAAVMIYNLMEYCKGGE